MQTLAALAAVHRTRRVTTLLLLTAALGLPVYAVTASPGPGGPQLLAKGKPAGEGVGRKVG
jgi:hypothetical protein